jgi:hypothetical protein
MTQIRLTVAFRALRIMPSAMTSLRGPLRTGERPLLRYRRVDVAEESRGHETYSLADFCGRHSLPLTSPRAHSD